MSSRAREVCRRHLADITKNAPADGDVDERWYWAAPMLLDLSRDATNAKAWFGQANLAGQWQGAEAAVSGDELSAEDDGDFTLAEFLREKLGTDRDHKMSVDQFLPRVFRPSRKLERRRNEFVARELEQMKAAWSSRMESGVYS